MPPELRNAGIAAAALALSMLLPWYQKSSSAGAASSCRTTCRAFGVFTFVEAAMLLVALRASCSSSGRARSGRAFHLPGGDGVAITLAGGWALLLLVWRLFDKPDVARPGRHDRHPVGDLRRAARRGRADRRGRARARRRTAPSRRTRPPTTSTGSPAARASASAAPGPPPARRRPPSPRCCATARRGRATPRDPGEERTTPTAGRKMTGEAARRDRSDERTAAPVRRPCRAPRRTRLPERSLGGARRGRQRRPDETPPPLGGRAPPR